VILLLSVDGEQADGEGYKQLLSDNLILESIGIWSADETNGLTGPLRRSPHDKSCYTPSNGTEVANEANGPQGPLHTNPHDKSCSIRGNAGNVHYVSRFLCEPAY
jgi:hypothetical protein